jgi:hypothetical protein
MFRRRHFFISNGKKRQKKAPAVTLSGRSKPFYLNLVLLRPDIFKLVLFVLR